MCLPELNGASAFPRSCLPFLCLPTCVPVWDGVPAFPRSCLHCLPTCFGWCLLDGVLIEALCLIVSHCLPLPPCPIVFQCLPTCVPVLDGVSVFRKFPLVSHCLPSCFPVLVGVSTLPCLSLSPSLSPSLSLVLFPFLAVVLFWIFLQTVYR